MAKVLDLYDPLVAMERANAQEVKGESSIIQHTQNGSHAVLRRINTTIAPPDFFYDNYGNKIEPDLRITRLECHSLYNDNKSGAAETPTVSPTTGSSTATASLPSKVNADSDANGASILPSDSSGCGFCDTSNSRNAINRTALWGHVWTPNTTRNMIRRTRKHIGNVGRLQLFINKLWRGEPTNILLVGGSNCRGAQIKTQEPRFPELIERWLNQAFPVAPKLSSSSPQQQQQQPPRKHTLYNRGSGGSGACVFSSDLDVFFSVAAPETVDLVLTEFSVNDGSESLSDVPDHTESRLCYEALVRSALKHSPHMAIVPIELANWLTMFNGVASHHDISAYYGLPSLTWRDAVISDMRSGIGPKFAGLATLSDAASATDYEKILKTHGSDSGYSSSSLWVDQRHLNLWSHNVVLDSFVHMIQQELKRSEVVVPDLSPNDWQPHEITKWRGEGNTNNNTIAGPLAEIQAVSGAFYRSTSVRKSCDAGLHWSYTMLRAEQYKRDIKFKTKEQFERMCNFEPISKTTNFTYYADRSDKPGWISTSPTPQSITFEVPLPVLPHPEVPHDQYSIRLGFLKSYEGMSQFTVQVEGMQPLTMMKSVSGETRDHEISLDALWDRNRSTNEEEEIALVTGSVNVTVTTKPDHSQNRKKLKILWVRAVGIGG